MKVPCVGVLVQWTPGSVWDTYPYQLHSSCSMGWEPVSFIKNAQKLRLRVDDCLIETDSADSTCTRCAGLPQTNKFQKFLSRAQDASESTNWSFLTSQQTMALLEKYSDKCRMLRTQVRSFLFFKYNLLKIIPMF